MRAETIQHQLTLARRSRRTGKAFVQHLESAWEIAVELGPTHPLFVPISYKRAKALFDTGRLHEALAALAPLLTHKVSLIEDYPLSHHAIRKLTRSFQNRHGYGNPIVLGLLMTLCDELQDRQLTTLRAELHLEIAWDAACRGDIPTLEEHTAVVANLRQSDDSQKVPRLKVRAAEVLLHHANWSLDEQRSRHAFNDLIDASDDLGEITSASTVALLESQVRFGFTPPQGPTEGTEFQEQYISALRIGEGFDRLSRLSPEEGPEWVLAVWQSRQHSAHPGPRPIDPNMFGCTVFRTKDHLKE